MRRYLDQLASILRPGSVGGADLALRSLAAYLIDHAATDADEGGAVRVRVSKARGRSWQ
jgi:hypothetical protein